MLGFYKKIVAFLLKQQIPYDINEVGNTVHLFLKKFSRTYLGRIIH